MPLINWLKSDERLFAETLREASIKDSIKFGNIKIKIEHGVLGKVGYNLIKGADRLNGFHQYTFIIAGRYVPISIQLYSHILYAYTKGGITLSINLKKNPLSNNTISLEQGINFYEQHITKESRKRKQAELSTLLYNLGYEIDNNKVMLGIFAPLKKKFLNTTTEKFLNDFIAFALLKGHFQGNKGYDLTNEPLFSKLLENTLQKIEKSEKTNYNQFSRTIPLKLRYAILKRDNSTCQRCGRTPKDGIILHIDHKIPYSLGGNTEENNLWTLCSDCNLGKSNKFIDN